MAQVNLTYYQDNKDRIDLRYNIDHSQWELYINNKRVHENLDIRQNLYSMVIHYYNGRLIHEDEDQWVEFLMGHEEYGQKVNKTCYIRKQDINYLEDLRFYLIASMKWSLPTKEKNDE